MPHTALHRDRNPLYLKVADILRQRIMRNVWKVGEKLPTVEKLAGEFQVARVTIREAVKILGEEGLVEAKRGRGTTVLPHNFKTRPLSVVTTLTELTDLYSRDEPDLLSLDDCVTDLPTGVTIGKPAGPYHMLKRIHMRDGKRYCVIAFYLMKTIFDKHEDAVRNELALPVLIADPDIEIATARQSLVVAKCDLETASHLDLSVGDPVAEVRRIVCDENDNIIFLADVIYRGDFIRLDMDLLG